MPPYNRNSFLLNHFYFALEAACITMSPSLRISLIVFVGLFFFGIVPNSDAFSPTPSHQPVPTVNTSNNQNTRRYFQDDDQSEIMSVAERKRREWIEESLNYYSKVMREERRRNLGQAKNYDSPSYQQEFSVLAKKHYFALRKIKDGKPAHAESIYRRIITEIQNEEEDEHCDHAQLAVTTLLLALHLQRTGAPPKRTRSVFLNFFRVAIVENGEDECACSAKVLQAFALFEMKQGNRLKSLELVKKAVQLDPTLRPVLKWKQFRDASARTQKQLPA